MRICKKGVAGIKREGGKIECRYGSSGATVPSLNLAGEEHYKNDKLRLILSDSGTLGLANEWNHMDVLEEDYLATDKGKAKADYGTAKDALIQIFKDAGKTFDPEKKSILLIVDASGQK